MKQRPKANDWQPGTGGAAMDFTDRLLAEAVRIYEDDGRRRLTLTDSHAVEGLDFEQRIIARAHSLPIAPRLRANLKSVKQLGRFIWIALLLVGVMIGAGLAGFLLRITDQQPVNFYWLLLVAFGLQSVALLLWLILALFPIIRSDPSTLSRTLFRIFLWLTQRLRVDATYLAALRARLTALQVPALGRWTMGAVSHSVWLAANLSFLLLTIILLSTRSYTFQWQTTILPESVFVYVTDWVAWLPHQLGFPVPDRAQIEASGPTGSAEALAHAGPAWAALLLGCIVVYGLFPRAILFSISIIGSKVARKKFRLDLTRYEPGYNDLRPSLHAGKRGLNDPNDLGNDEDLEQLSASHGANSNAKKRRLGKAMFVALELQFELQNVVEFYHLPVSGYRAIDSKQDRDALLQDLAHMDHEPSPIVIICDLNTTADRGHASFILQMQQCLTNAVYVLLSGAERWRAEHGDHPALLQKRIMHWIGLLKRIGCNRSHVLQLDFEHLTHHAASKLAQQLLAQPMDLRADTVQYQSDERFAHWRSARNVIEAFLDHVDNPEHNSVNARQNAAQKSLETLYHIYQHDTPRHAVASTQASTIVRDAEQAVKKQGALVGDKANETVQSLQHPIRAALRRLFQRAAGAHDGRSRVLGFDNEPVDDQPNKLLYATAVLIREAIMLDLQGRCDDLAITSVLERVFDDPESGHAATESSKRVSSTKLEAARICLQRWTASYEALCRQEGLG